ncbi:RlpA-like protein precursor [Mariniflexile rhizosphaerae]|uniref:septal ring lytic transglycosylase RlpA family protein n=1 Tax=unclassified Mariniflexile TaxID=2643887 RepID=UPI000CB15A1A|nr:septal ring lytic transglycosylase RlpA family protein [Mariniflexile sp. TRM1-10]AXP82637.1 RlpA-like protein precursor [Mariniflexile sp. TRM1-10]PLB18259.1 MAG: Rare lipoprotein A [Flavobacteriaceae bacterium FS1-H7996/R]
MSLATKITSFIALLILISSFTTSKKAACKTVILNNKYKDSILSDTIHLDSSLTTYIPYKESVHASYYHDKFNGRKTASGDKFNNDLYTAAHKTLKFGTKVKVTNIVNDSSVIVTINDRGPFVKGREIDLSKKAFMEIAKYKHRGFLIVNIEILEEPL